jgi:hypothetical protein
LHHDVLAGFHVSLEDARELRPAAEVLAVNGLSVLEGIHDFPPLAVLHYAILHYAVLHNECIVPNCADAGKGARAAHLQKGELSFPPQKQLRETT